MQQVDSPRCARCDKKQFDLPYVRKVDRESMCNPAGQADLLNRAGSELNVLCALRVGHDAIYSQYIRRQFGV